MNETREDGPILRSGGETKEFFILIALTVGLFLSGLFMILTPAPTALGFARRGVRRAWVVPACSALLGGAILFAMGLSEVGPYLILIAMGAVIGYGFERRWTTDKTVGLSSLLVVGVAAFFALLAFIQTRGQIVHLFEQNLRAIIETAMKQFNSGGAAKTEEMKKSLLGMVPEVVRLMPGIFLSSTILTSWINLLLCRRYCRALPGEQGEEGSLSLWKSPEHLVWVAIACGLMLLLPSSGVNLLGFNLLWVIGTIYFLQGLAIVAFYVQRTTIPLFFRGFVYALLFLTATTRIAVAALGFFDVWFDFRKRNKQA